MSFQLMGGLGNQLFIYFAARFAREINGYDVVLELSENMKANHVGSATHMFQLAPIPTKRLSFGQIQVRNLLSSVYSKLPALRRFPRIFSTTILPTEIGFVGNFSEYQSRAHLVAYFQTWKYFHAVRENLGARELSLTHTSDWLFNELTLASAAKPIMVHVRRGDYAQFSNLYGLLDSGYYVRAVHALREHGEHEDSPIWFFSDDIQAVRLEFEKIFDSESVRWVQPPCDTPDEESMILLSAGAALITGNSTFSWWAGAISKHQKVVAPKPWTKSLSEPNLLIPDSWTRIDSSWT